MRRPAESYDPFTIILHWLIAVLIVGSIALGFVMVRLSIDPTLQFSLFQWHKSFGMLALLLAIIRLLYSLIFVRVGRVVGMSAIEHLGARTVHHLLLAFSVVVPLAGWVIASISPLEIPTFAFDLVVIPHLPLAKSDAGEAWWSAAHAVLAYSALALVLLHSGAALYHHYRRRDDVLTRMLGVRRRMTSASAGER